MDRRLELSNLLKEILGSNHVYFQRPQNTAMVYPAIVYSREDVVNNHADNRPYLSTDRWQIMCIDENPDSQIWRKVLELPMSSFDRTYPADGLYHTIISLHF